MSNAGLNAIAEFDTRKMRRIAEHDTYKMGRSDSLLWYNTHTNSFTPVLLSKLYGAVPTNVFPGADGQWGRTNVDDDNNGVIDDISEAGWQKSDDIYQPVNNIRTSPSFCIDPFFIAQQMADNNLTDPATSFFPGIPIPAGNPDQIVNMRRVTLTRPAHITDANGNEVYLGPNLHLSLLQCREIFLAKDDLSISKPTSGTELPQQTWITTPAGNYVKRLNAAETSWMATLTPTRNREDPQNNTKLEPTDQYLISIVVFNRRYVNYKADTANVQKERRFDVKFLNGGYGGGEVELLHTDPTKLDLKHGDWIMLAANSTIGPFFRWYRITYVDDQINQNSGGSYYRSMTIQGPDWTRPEWHGNGTGKSHATFIPGVVGVFEKTIRFESTSLFNSP
jgi:hypothetical protein